MLRFKTDDALPPELAAQARVTGRIAQVKAHDAAEVESMLAACARPACASRTWRSAAPTWRTCSSRSCSRRRPREPGRREDAVHKEILRFWKVAFQTVAAPVLTAVLYLLIFGHVLEGM
jgi:hypothetical protein